MIDIPHLLILILSYFHLLAQLIFSLPYQSLFSGTDLLLHPCHGARAGGLGGAGVGPGEGGGLGGGGAMPGHPGLDSGHMPGSTVMFNNSFYTPHQPFNTLFSPSSYTVHPPATVRPTSRELDMAPGGQGAGAMRHPSGGSVGSHTPPSPEERAAYPRPSGALMERTGAGGQRGSFEARQCNSVGSDGQAGSSPGGAGYRLLQPPSPASQKSPFDMTTMGMSKSLGSSYTSTSHVSSPGTGSAFQRTGQVITARSAYSIKQEPGSPASGSRPAMMKTSASPSSPASPPPVTVGARLGAPGSNGAAPSQGFNFPSPQANNNSHPISPAAGESTATAASGMNNNNSSNNNHPRPGVSSKFRYPSGPTPVQTMSPGDSTTSNSALSSREGTPGPGPRPWCGAEGTEVGPNTAGAPNIDISNVTVKA